METPPGTSGANKRLKPGPIREAKRSKFQFPPRKPHILIGCCGCEAAINFVSLCQSFTPFADVKVVVTEGSLPFCNLETLRVEVETFRDKDEWVYWKGLGDTVLHIGLSQWADVLLIAPLSANTLAKIVGGLCDNLLTCIVRAWDFKKPTYIAPTMNYHMWKNHFTQVHLAKLESWGASLLRPVFHVPDNAIQPALMVDIPFINQTIKAVLFPDRRSQDRDTVLPMES